MTAASAPYMVRLENVNKAYRFRGDAKVVADDITLNLPPGATIGLLGRNGAGKSTLLRMIAGSLNPDSGRIRVAGAMSWPIGLATGIHGDLSGAQNTRFLARVYGADTDELMAFVEDFCELGIHFHQPIRTYSSGMRAKLNFAVSFGMKFDTYLIDEVTAVGDVAFRAKSEVLFQSRMQSAGAIVVTHSPDLLRRICKAGAVLENGKLTLYTDINEAIHVHNLHMLGRRDE